MSAQGRANIIAAQKARWAKIRAEKSTTAASTTPSTTTRQARKRKAAGKK